MIKVNRKCNQCEKNISLNDRVWFKGTDLYCNSNCLIASFGNNQIKEEQNWHILREKFLNNEKVGIAK